MLCDRLRNVASTHREDLKLLNGGKGKKEGPPKLACQLDIKTAFINSLNLWLNNQLRMNPMRAYQ